MKQYYKLGNSDMFNDKVLEYELYSNHGFSIMNWDVPLNIDKIELKFWNSLE